MNNLGRVVRMAEVAPNNLEVGKLYYITHRVREGAPKTGRFMGFIESADGFASQRAKFAMEAPVFPLPTRSFQPENWKFEAVPEAIAQVVPVLPVAGAAAPQQAGSRRLRSSRRSRRRLRHRRRISRRR